MSDIHIRLKEIRKYFDLSIREFSKKIYFSYSLYAKVEHGDREPTDRIIELICSKFKVNKEWILKGSGDMFTSAPPDVGLEKLLEIYNIVDDSLKNCMVKQSKALLELHKERNSDSQ